MTLNFNAEGDMNIGLDGRDRDENGRIREKNGTTRVDTLRRTYGEDFLRSWRGDAHLETVRGETGKSLTELVREHRTKK